MTEALLLIICEEGWVDFEALARAGGCNRSLYGVCEKALRPAVEKKRFRLFRKIERAATERVRAYELAQLRDLEVGNETWADRKVKISLLAVQVARAAQQKRVVLCRLQSCVLK